MSEAAQTEARNECCGLPYQEPGRLAWSTCNRDRLAPARFRYWRWRSRKPGGPPIPMEHIALIRRISSDHPDRGGDRIAIGLRRRTRKQNRIRQEIQRNDPSLKKVQAVVTAQQGTISASTSHSVRRV